MYRIFLLTCGYFHDTCRNYLLKLYLPIYIPSAFLEIDLEVLVIFLNTNAIKTFYSQIVTKN